MFSRCRFAVAGLMQSSAAISLFVFPFATSFNTFLSCAVRSPRSLPQFPIDPAPSSIAQNDSPASITKLLAISVPGASLPFVRETSPIFAKLRRQRSLDRTIRKESEGRRLSTSRNKRELRGGILMLEHVGGIFGTCGFAVELLRLFFEIDVEN